MFYETDGCQCKRWGAMSSNACTTQVSFSRRDHVNTSKHTDTYTACSTNVRIVTDMPKMQSQYFLSKPL